MDEAQKPVTVILNVDPQNCGLSARVDFNTFEYTDKEPLTRHLSSTGALINDFSQAAYSVFFDRILYCFKIEAEYDPAITNLILSKKTVSLFGRIHTTYTESSLDFRYSRYLEGNEFVEGTQTFELGMLRGIRDPLKLTDPNIIQFQILPSGSITYLVNPISASARLMQYTNNSKTPKRHLFQTLRSAISSLDPQIAGFIQDAYELGLNVANNHSAHLLTHGINVKIPPAIRQLTSGLENYQPNDNLEVIVRKQNSINTDIRSR